MPITRISGCKGKAFLSNRKALCIVIMYMKEKKLQRKVEILGISSIFAIVTIN